MPGIKIEEISGGEQYTGRLWEEMARQVYCENGREAYREIGHYKNGAPFLYGETQRISISHCRGLYVVATLPPTPEVEEQWLYNERSAMGVDAERADREQVLKIRDKFLSAEEQAMIGADEVDSNVLAWTVKEAVYKACMTDGLDLAEDIKIVRMPQPGPPTPVFDSRDYGLAPEIKELPESYFGEAIVVGDFKEDPRSDYKTKSGAVEKDIESNGGKDGKAAQREHRFKIYSYRSDDCIVTLAYSPRCAKFGKLSQM